MFLRPKHALGVYLTPITPWMQPKKSVFLLVFYCSPRFGAKVNAVKGTLFYSPKWTFILCDKGSLFMNKDGITWLHPTKSQETGCLLVPKTLGTFQTWFSLFLLVNKSFRILMYGYIRFFGEHKYLLLVA
jgi:hypothetical protein